MAFQSNYTNIMNNIIIDLARAKSEAPINSNL